MKRGFLCLAALLAGLGCVREHQCRDGTILITLEFRDGSQVVDGVAMRYRLDDGPTLDVTPAVARTGGNAQGVVELVVKDYGKHRSLVLQYAPTKGGALVGDWQTASASLSGSCVAGTLTIKAPTNDAGATTKADVAKPADSSVPSSGPDATSASTPDLAPDRQPDLGPGPLPDAGPDLSPDVGPLVEPEVEPPFGPDSALEVRLPADLALEVPAFEVLVPPPPREGGVDLPVPPDAATDGLPDLAPDRIPAPDLAEAALTTNGTTSLVFGSVAIGSTSTVQSFLVTNTGQQPTGSLVLTTSNADFVMRTDLASDCRSVLTLAPGSSCTVRIAFAPTSVGDRSGVFVISAATVATTVTVSLSGTGLPSAAVTISPSAGSFPDTPIGGTSEQIFTVSNSSSSTTDTGAITFSLGGTNAADFSIRTNGCTLAVSPGTSCTVTVEFSPSTKGQRSAQLNLVSSKGLPTGATLGGLGLLQIEIVPNPPPVAPATGFDFGQTPVGVPGAVKNYDVWVRSAVGQTTNTLTVVLTNAGGSNDFVILTDSCSVSPAKTPSLLVPACQLSIQFAPISGKGAKTASFSVSGSAGGSDGRTLTGTATSPLVIVPAPLDFGKVAVGSSSPETALTVRNVGAASLSPQSLELGGTNFADFTIASDGCTGVTLSGPSGTCLVKVKLTPSALGARTATFTVTGSGETATVSLQGEGVAAPVLSVAPSPYDFGSVARGGTGTFVAFTVSATGAVGTGAINYQLTGAAASDFVLANGTNTSLGTCGQSGDAGIDPGGSCTIKVAFAPASGTATGSKTASLQVQASPGGSASASPLTGTATP